MIDAMNVMCHRSVTHAKLMSELVDFIGSLFFNRVRCDNEMTTKTNENCNFLTKAKCEKFD